MSKRNRFDLPEFFRKPEYYDFLKGTSESEFRALLKKQDLVGIDLVSRKFQAMLKDQKSKYDSLVKRHESLEEDYNNLLYISSNTPPTNEIKSIKEKQKHEATAKVIWSDWHIDEIVDPKTVNGLNKYNPEIAKKRSEICAFNTLKLIETQRHAVKIDNLVLHLGGDFIGGWIHEELQQTNSMSPVDATIYAIELLSSALSHIVNHGKFKKIVAICTVGNHGRTTKKVQIANEVSTNYELFIYSALKSKFGSTIDFIIAESGIVYYEIYRQMGRLYHGHQIKFGGGIGGLTVPLNRKQADWDRTIKSDWNSMCHYHMFGFPNNRTTLNGSLKGFDTFAQHIGAKHERPLQAFELFDSLYGQTIKAPIICE
jgi:hypothetical protein